MEPTGPAEVAGPMTGYAKSGIRFADGPIPPQLRSRGTYFHGHALTGHPRRYCITWRPADGVPYRAARASLHGRRHCDPAGRAVMSKRFDVRLAVGVPNGPRSDVWHYWSRNESVYVANANMGGIVKFSFHPPNICRYAFTKEHGTPAALPDRATKLWRRDPTLPAGARKIVRVLRVGFWTDVLSTALASQSKEPIWIKPAPLGNTTIVDLMTKAHSRPPLRQSHPHWHIQWSRTGSYQTEKPSAFPRGIRLLPTNRFASKATM